MNNVQFDEMYAILEQSFPKNEFRGYEGQKKLLEREDYFILTHKLNDEVVGICAYYELETALYIEHLATTPIVRGKGTGAVLMNQMKELATKLNKIIVLEVEPPQDEMTKRRIGFYERLGLNLDSRYHYQPSLNKDTEGLELNIMSTKHDLSESEHNQIRYELNEKVYGVDKMAYFKKSS